MAASLPAGLGLSRTRGTRAAVRPARAGPWQAETRRLAS